MSIQRYSGFEPAITIRLTIHQRQVSTIPPAKIWTEECIIEGECGGVKVHRTVATSFDGRTRSAEETDAVVGDFLQELRQAVHNNLHKYASAV